VVTNPYRFQSKLSQALHKTLLAHSGNLHPGG
jgi:hypothetical protein